MRSRIPPTFKDKQKRMEAVATEHIADPGVYVLSVLHDDDCPTLNTQSLADCTCDPEMLPPERIE